MIKPLPSFFHLMGFGPLNLGAFLQARVSDTLQASDTVAPQLHAYGALCAIPRKAPSLSHSYLHGFPTADHVSG